MCFHLSINYYISGGRFLSIKYHISSPVVFMKKCVYIRKVKIKNDVPMTNNIIIGGSLI